MKKSRMLKSVILVIFAALIIFCVYNLYNSLRTGNQSIEIITGNQYYSNSNIEAIIKVKDIKKYESISSTIKLELLNSSGKKVKGIKETYKIEEGESANITIKLLDDMETGSYSIKVTSKSKIGTDIIEVPVSIINERDSNISISLDKGIYKPGDEVNFRALITSKSDDTPERIDVSVYIYDGNGNKVYSESVESSEYGIVQGTFTLANEVNSGTYKLVISTENKEVTKTFNVNPYVTPKFEVEVTSDKENYIAGETAEITVNAKYFFGEPVVNASVSGTINEKEFVGITDPNGQFTKNYTIDTVGKNNIKLEVTDTSNYLVEANKTIVGSTDIFEIEVLPENGDIIKGIDNNIYIFTKKADGTPVKTYATITMENITRQVITDENGIGKFTLTSSDLSEVSEKAQAKVSYNSKANSSSTSAYNPNTDNYISEKKTPYITIVAKDMEDNSVTVKKDVNIIQNTGTIINTDKVKYNVGDDINISLNSTTDTQENIIYVYKNKELIKMIRADSREVTINLEDTYGLIDIYTGAKKTNNYGTTTAIIDDSYSYDTSYSSSYNKRTIFIKPDKALNIEIETNSEEYEPGDTLNIKFTTTNESNQSVDSALLVSVLDEAILSLAENDLSIDNIKLALEDIELIDGMTAADLYANIIDDSSDTALVGILLKQSKSDPNIINNSYNNKEEKKLAQQKAIILVILIATIAIICAFIKSKRFGNFAVDFVNLIGIFIALNLFFYEFIYYNLGASFIISLIIMAVITLIVYILALYKIKETLFNMIIELVIIPLPVILIIGLLSEYINFENYVLILIGLIPPAILSVVTVMSRNNKLSKVLEFLKNICKKITKTEVFYIILFVITELFNIYSIQMMVIVLTIIYLVFNKIFDKNNKNSASIKEGKVTLNVTGSESIGIIALILIVLVIGLIMNYIYNSSAGGIAPIYYTDSFGSTLDGGLDSYSINSMQESSISTKSSSALEGIFDDASSLFNNSGVVSQASDAVINVEDREVVEETITSETEENIRNVFLESLAFIPELVTSNGIAETTIKISDNITTWNIQTVGNTKDGNIGYSQSSIKVFKEFFIDFELPTNSVVTDKISIPVTVYNYTEQELILSLNVKENDWCTIGEYSKDLLISANGTKMIYLPLEILNDGSNTLRVEAKSGSFSDIVEKTMEIKPNGLEKTTVISSGTIESKMSQDVIFDNKDIIDGTSNLTVKLYASPIAQAIEGIESIFRMPTGCFEQTSSSLYPNILALRYLEENNLSNNEIKEKALSYISSGYQRLLTFEVKGEKGGYSLYGKSPAEPVLTAYGLMELKDLSEVYNIDENVLENMKEYLYGKQKVNGSFDLGNSDHLGGAGSSDTISLNSYIIWALSESYSDDSRLEKSIKYLEDNIDKMNDSYTLALVANAFANVDSSSAKTVVNKLMEKVQTDGENAYIESEIMDYYGSYGTSQNIQTTALASIALTKLNSNTKTNNAFVNYLISKKDKYGNWYSTQATVLSLKALVEYSNHSDISNQEITVIVNGESQVISIDENTIDVYELNFDDVDKENSITINMKKGKIYYEIIQNYYVNYIEANTSSTILININQEIKQSVKVNDIVAQRISIDNYSGDNILNGMIEINVPQGFSVIEDSLMQLEYDGLIQKYEYSYGKVYLYLKNFAKEDSIEVEVQYRANYPVDITGGSIRVYDYYNPEIEGICMPVGIRVNE